MNNCQNNNYILGNGLSPPIRIAVLAASYEYLDSVFKSCVPFNQVKVHNPCSKCYQFEEFFLHKHSAVQQVTDLVNSGRYDVFMNLCDGTDNTPGVELVDYLISRQVPLACANPKYFTMSKSDMKKAADEYRVPTPAYFFINKNDGFDQKIDQILTALTFPLIVKYDEGYGSLGMTEHSKVNNKEELIKEVTRTTEEFGGALIEEFITGREFTILVAENPYNLLNPTVYDPLECILPSLDSFKYFDLKFKDYGLIKWIPVQDVQISKDLKSLSKAMFLAVNANSFGRVDFRENEKTGKIYMLEINSQCSILYPKEYDGSADIILYQCNGHKKFVENMIICAMVDHQKSHGTVCPLIIPKTDHDFC